MHCWLEYLHHWDSYAGSSSNQVGFGKAPYVLWAFGENIVIGDNLVMCQTTILVFNDVAIGNDVLLGGGVKIHTSGFHF